MHEELAVPVLEAEECAIIAYGSNPVRLAMFLHGSKVAIPHANTRHAHRRHQPRVPGNPHNSFTQAGAVPGLTISKP